MIENCLSNIINKNIKCQCFETNLIPAYPSYSTKWDCSRKNGVCARLCTCKCVRAYMTVCACLFWSVCVSVSVHAIYCGCVFDCVCMHWLWVCVWLCVYALILLSGTWMCVHAFVCVRGERTVRLAARKGCVLPPCERAASTPPRVFEPLCVRVLFN